MRGLAIAACLASVAGCSDPVDPPGREATDAARPEPSGLADTAPRFRPDDILSADAKVGTFEMLRDGLAQVPDPSDGGGRVELASAISLDGPGAITAGRPARFELRYVAGPLGVAEGGMVFLQPSPFWDWSPPHTFAPTRSGYTEVSTDAEGVELDTQTFESVIAVTIRGRALEEGEAIDFVYGAGPAGALVDRYRERGAEISVAVDGDGDGFRKLVPIGARVDVGPGPPARIVVTAPTVVRPGEPFEAHAHVVDAIGNAGLTGPGALSWSLARASDASPPDLEGLPARTTIAAGESAGAQVALVAPETAGVLRVTVTGGAELDGIGGVSNPIIIHPTTPRVRWADLHGHSQLSDGTGTPDDYFAYARDVARLDVAALTDHDHWGLRFLDEHPDMWDEIKRTVAAHHDPGEFVTVLGYEWTSWLHGHRHVLYFDDDGPVLSSMDPAYTSPAQLWDGLRGLPAMTFAHHSAGGPVSTNWAYGADPVLEPVTEVVSVHGSSEAADTPGRIYSPVNGNTVRDVLQAGIRFGFIGSGDSHDGHPGLTHLASPGGSGGLAALLTEEKTRAGVQDALRARRTYATNGHRIWLHVEIDGQPMGTVLPAAGDDAAPLQRLRVEVAGTAPIERIDLVRSGRVATIPVEPDQLEVTHERELPRLGRGEYHYVRVVQRDGQAAWSSPIYAD